MCHGVIGRECVISVIKVHSIRSVIYQHLLQSPEERSWAVPSLTGGTRTVHLVQTTTAGTLSYRSAGQDAVMDQFSSAFDLCVLSILFPANANYSVEHTVHLPTDLVLGQCWYLCLRILINSMYEYYTSPPVPYVDMYTLLPILLYKYKMRLIKDAYGGYSNTHFCTI
jgi:hypothetical protein